MKTTKKAWAVWDVKAESMTFVAFKKGDWYIAPSERKRFKPIPITISYTLPKLSKSKKV